MLLRRCCVGRRRRPYCISESALFWSDLVCQVSLTQIAKRLSAIATDANEATARFAVPTSLYPRTISAKRRAKQKPMSVRDLPAKMDHPASVKTAGRRCMSPAKLRPKLSLSKRAQWMIWVCLIQNLNPLWRCSVKRSWASCLAWRMFSLSLVEWDRHNMFFVLGRISVKSIGWRTCGWEKILRLSRKPWNMYEDNGGQPGDFSPVLTRELYGI